VTRLGVAAVRGVHAVDLVSDVGQGSTADLPIQDRRLGPRPGTSRHRLLSAPMPRGTSGRCRSLVVIVWWIMGVNRGLAGRRAQRLRGSGGDRVPRHVTLELVFDSIPPKLRGSPGLDRPRLRRGRRSEPTDALQPAGLRHVCHRARLGARPTADCARPPSGHRRVQPGPRRPQAARYPRDAARAGAGCLAAAGPGTTGARSAFAENRRPAAHPRPDASSTAPSPSSWPPQRSG